MKKIFGIITLLTYLISTSSLSHAGMMGFLSNHQMGTTMNNSVLENESSVTSCEDNNKDNFKQKKSHKMDCCEFSNSNQINQSNTRSKDLTKLLRFVQPIDNPISLKISYIDIYKPYLTLSPGWDTHIKYQKFSDLVGIIVNVI